MDALGNQLLGESLVARGWNAWICKRTRFHGFCSFNLRGIYVSDWCVAHCHDTEDTIRHEIAHAIVDELGYKEEGHGNIWKSMARLCGADPEQSKPRFDPNARYQYHCPGLGCTYRASWLRRPGRFYALRKCPWCGTLSAAIDTLVPQEGAHV